MSVQEAFSAMLAYHVRRERRHPLEEHAACQRLQKARPPSGHDTAAPVA